MKILYLTAVPPSPRYSGTGIRLFNTLRGLASCGQVTLVAVVDKKDSDLLADCEPWCEEMIVVDQATTLASRYSYDYRPPRWEEFMRAFGALSPLSLRSHDASGLQRLMQSIGYHRFDLIWVAKGWLAGMLPALDSGKVVVDLDDLDYRVQLRMLRLSVWFPTIVFGYMDAWKQWLFQQRLCRRARRIAVSADGDRQLLGHDNVRWLPNCVDLPEKAGLGRTEQPYRLLFIGKMNYAPNVDAALFFCESVLPQIRRREPRVHAYIVGRDPAPEVRALHTGVEVVVTGEVPDVTPYFDESALIVVPLRAGGGTRIKILEALSWGKCVVSTTVGAEGLDVVDGVHLCLADSAADFADACLRLLADESKRRTMGLAGRQLVETRYSQTIFHQAVRNIVGDVTGSLPFKSASSDA